MTPPTPLADDLRGLDHDITDLRVSNGRLEESVQNLTKKVDELAGTVKSLNDTMNKGKGALWLIVLFAGSVGAMVTTALKKIAGVT